MKLIIARHGNTFAPGDAVVWTGSSNDIPLVEAGKAQALALADYLQSQTMKPSRILAGPLIRTKEYAEIIASRMQLDISVEIENRLTEIDYGSWTGLTNAEVSDRFGSSEQDLWNDSSVWPSEADWGGSETQVVDEVVSLASSLNESQDSDDVILLVSSNGRIRYFLKLIDGAYERHIAMKDFKVRTGAFCEMQFSEGSWQVLQWNVRPEELDQT